MDEVVGVMGCSGGIGASGFAAALARAAPRAVLVDLDAAAGGIDVLLGVDDRPGVRWSGVGAGPFDGAALRHGLPQWDDRAVLAADGVEPVPVVVRAVVAAAAGSGPVVLDLPRARGPARSAGLAACRLVVLLARADAGGIASAHAVVGSLDGAPAALVVRRGFLPPREVAAAVGVPLLGVLPGEAVPPRAGAAPRAVAALTAGIWAGLRTSRASGASGASGVSGWAA